MVLMKFKAHPLSLSYVLLKYCQYDPVAAVGNAQVSRACGATRLEIAPPTAPLPGVGYRARLGVSGPWAKFIFELQPTFPNPDPIE